MIAFNTGLHELADLLFLSMIGEETAKDKMAAIIVIRQSFILDLRGEQLKNKFEVLIRRVE